MGFDLTVECALHVCEKTGKLFYYGNDSTGNFVRVYDPINIEVPEEHRAEMVQRGRILHVYTDEFNDRDIFNVDIWDFLENFPSWKAVRDWMSKYEWSLDDWNEEKHKKFKAALEWCSTTQFPFRVSWSY